MQDNFNQSFSTYNLRKIFDLENRKRNPALVKYFPEIMSISADIQDRSIRTKEFTDEMIALTKSKDKMLEIELGKISTKILDPDFSIKINKNKINKNKINKNEIKDPEYSYTEDENVGSFFALKQIFHSLKQLYEMKELNQYQTTCQLKEILSGEIQKNVLQASILSFYESIDRKIIIDTLRRDRIMTNLSIKFICQILFNYGKISKSEKGIPKKVKLCVLLAEIYMLNFDKSIRNYEGVVYYSRYIDNIIVVYCNLKIDSIKKLRSHIQDQLASINLKINKEHEPKIKTNSCLNLDYLRYKYIYKDNKIDLKMADSTFQRYKLQINLAFKFYNYMKIKNVRKANKILKKKIQYLTGNTHIIKWNNKILVGIYFSNSLLTCIDDLENLDAHLESKIKLLDDSRLKSRLQLCSFKNGFTKKIYHKLTK